MVFLAQIPKHSHASDMANDKPYKTLVAANQEIEPDAERIWHLMEWAELIHKDLGAFIGALDRFYMEKNAVGKPPSMDFLSAVKNNASKRK